MFYPELFLMIPASLRALNVSLLNSYRIFVLLVNACTVFIAYISFKNIFKKQEYGVVGSFLFVLSIYRLNSLYVRSAVGEYLAMMFLPLLAWGLYECFYGNHSKWWITTLAMTGILQSHLITTELSAAVCLVLGLIHLPALIKDKSRLLDIIKAVSLFVVLNIWWLIPFLEYSLFGVGALMRDIGVQEPMVHQITDLFAITYPIGTGAEMPFSVGFLLFIFACGYTLLQTNNGFRKSKWNKLGLVLLGLSLILLWMATIYFPWNDISILKSIGGTLQFSWRTLSVTTILLVIIGLMFIKAFESKRYYTVLLLFTCIASCLLSIRILWGYYSEIPVVANKSYLANIDADGYTLDGWYLPVDTEIYYLYYEPGTIKTTNEAEISNFKRKGTTLSFDYNCSLDNTLELPVIYYPGYHVEINNQEVEIRNSSNNLVEFDIDVQSAHIVLEYKDSLAYVIANGISLVGVGMLLITIRRGMKK